MANKTKDVTDFGSGFFCLFHFANYMITYIEKPTGIHFKNILELL